MLRCSYLVKEESPRYILHGTNGSFLKWGIDPQEELLKKGILPVGDQWGEEPESAWGLLNGRNEAGDFRLRKKTLPGDYGAFYNNLYDVIRYGKTPAVRPEEARDVIRILELCLESHMHRRTIEVK